MSSPRTLQKPRRLSPGDTIAAVTPSWGGPGMFPGRYEAGKRQMEETFGVRIVEMAHTLADPQWVAAHPQARAMDLMAAFADPAISGIVTSIGGDDSIRLLPHLDLDIIASNPKVFLGFSDTTSLHLACYKAGLSSFYGPSMMAGLAESGGIHRYTVEALRRALFDPAPIGLIQPNHEGWTDERQDWSDPALQPQPRRLAFADAPRILQGSGSVTGHLLGGCAEVLEMAKGTSWWPDPEAWRGAILFYETSEDAPSPQFIRYWLRNFAVTGLLDGLAGVLIARPAPSGDPAYPAKVEAAIIEGLAEAGLTELPVLAGLDFGHTQPMLTLPYGASARIDCATASLTILEAGVV